MGNIPSTNTNDIRAAIDQEKAKVVLSPYTPTAEKNYPYSYSAASKSALVTSKTSVSDNATEVVFQNGLKLKIFINDKDELGKFQITIRVAFGLFYSAYARYKSIQPPQDRYEV
jgi:hypothetical protein